MKKTDLQKRKVLFLTGLILVGVILGAIALFVINLNNSNDTWEFELEDGKLVLDAKDREQIRKLALDATLNDEEIKDLISGKDYTTQVTLFGTVQFESVFENITLVPSTTRLSIVCDEPLDTINVVVTITFSDGSGYNVPVEWKNWTVGEPEYAEKVTPPEDLIRIEPKFTSREDFIQSVFTD